MWINTEQNQSTMKNYLVIGTGGNLSNLIKAINQKLPTNSLLNRDSLEIFPGTPGIIK